MSTNIEIDSESLAKFCDEFGVRINYTLEQSQNLRTQGKTKLSVDQVENIAQQICVDTDCLAKFIEQKSVAFQPVSMSLFVINDALWKIMGKKDDHPDKMLPMSTIPWFYWEKEAEDRKTPFGVRRLEVSDKPLPLCLYSSLLNLGCENTHEISIVWKHLRSYS